MLEVDEVRVRRSGFQVSVSGLVIQSGQRLTIVGPSGGGKSTLLRALLGLEPEAFVRGLRWRGVDVSYAPPHRRPFGWLPQELGLWPHLRAIEHLAFARTRGRNARPVAEDEELLLQVGIQHRALALPAELSGGERQRLAFARVIAMRPAWAVLDEPFSNLDPVIADELGSSFAILAQLQGMGLIQVSHRLQRPADDELFLAIENGAVSQFGRWAQLKESPATPWIRRFVELQQ